ncbi:fatty acid-binding protein DegV [Paenibacillus sp. Root52]|uniref:DegV family protein with EDD domain n=1 Tax=Paenibacillus amylolyticus TaxID=1451 RepID=A0AAP5H3W5_PAEAM|nr:MULTISPECIES: DegV family protein [Paenibacillus]KQY92943.1 fatty acid-binding protein DegV [Paenibacillus sp. Root52]MDR6725844.1 DegV family protein with EDD domain [Paenibacillus amylolyticus]
MKKIAWVTDSTSTLDPVFAEQNHVYIVPLRVVFGEECYRESEDITPELFYEKLETASKASSSQPPIGEFIELYESLKDQYDEIITIHCSTALSGTLHTSMQAAEIAGVKVTAIDSMAGAYPHREMILQGLEWQKQGASAAEIKANIEQMIENMSFYLIPASLQNLHRSGRVSGTQLVLSQLLKIHLLLRFEEGKVVVNEKIRTFKRAKQRMLDVLKVDMEKVKHVCIMHANNPDEAVTIKQQISELLPRLKTEIMPFIPVVGIHAGAGTIGLCWFRNEHV